MNNIQKAFKGKAKRGLCMATGGVLDQNSRPIAAPVIQGNADLIQNPRSIQGYNEWGGGGQLTSMDHDAMASMNSLSPSTQPAGNPFYGGAFGNDPRMTASNNPSIQRASVPPPSPRRPAPNMMTPVDELIPSRRGLQMANGGVVDPVEALLARTKANYGVGNTSQPAVEAPRPATPPVSPAPQTKGGLLDRAVQGLRGRAAQIDKAVGMAQGGVVAALPDERKPYVAPRTNDPYAMVTGRGAMAANDPRAAVVQRPMTEETDPYLEAAGKVVDSLPYAAAQFVPGINLPLGALAATVHAAQGRTSELPLDAASMLPGGKGVRLAKGAMLAAKRVAGGLGRAANSVQALGAADAFGAPAYAQGGVARVKGPGTGTSDDIPVTLRTDGEGMNINISNGEGLAVLSKKTMQHPEAVGAINTIIEATNGKPTATRGLRAGGHYAEGSRIWWDRARGAVSDAMSAGAEKVRPTAAPEPAVAGISVGEATPEEFARAQNTEMRAKINAAANGTPTAQPAPAPEAPAAPPPRVDGRGAPFEVNGPLTADGRAAELRGRAMANTNVRPNTTVVGQLAEGVKDVSQTVGKGLSKVAAVANNPLVRNTGYTGVALSAIEPIAETFQNKNQIRRAHPDFATNPAGAIASRTDEILANTVDLGLKGVDNLSDMTRLPMNWAVEKLGGPKNYFRGRTLSNALHSVYGAEPTAGTGPVPSDVARKDRVAASIAAQDANRAAAEPGAQERTFNTGASGAAAPVVQADTRPNAPPANDIQRRTIRTPDGRTQTEFYGKDVKQTYTGADGKPTNSWYDTQDYKDSQVRAAKDKELLKTYEKWGLEGDLKSNNEFYQRRGLARQKAFDENARAEAARDIAMANRDIQQQELGIRREDLGLRRAQEARALTAAQFDREQKILETQRKATEDMDKDEKQAYDAYLPMFTAKGKDAQGNEIDIEDKAAHAAFINAARHTMARRGVVNPVNGKPISFGSLDKKEQDRLFQRYKAVQRLKSTMGNYPWNADKADSLNLDDFDAVQNPDGTLSFPALEARLKGRTIRARQKDFEYADGPSKWYDPFQTPDNSMLQALLTKRGQ